MQCLAEDLAEDSPGPSPCRALSPPPLAALRSVCAAMSPAALKGAEAEAKAKAPQPAVVKSVAIPHWMATSNARIRAEHYDNEPVEQATSKRPPPNPRVEEGLWRPSPLVPHGPQEELWQLRYRNTRPLHWSPNKTAMIHGRPVMVLVRSFVIVFWLVFHGKSIQPDWCAIRHSRILSKVVFVIKNVPPFTAPPSPSVSVFLYIRCSGSGVDARADRVREVGHVFVGKVEPCPPLAQLWAVVQGLSADAAQVLRVALVAGLES